LEGVSEMARSDSWSGLVEETRQALATLRAEDLEELASRAQAMFNEIQGQETLRIGQPPQKPLSVEGRARLAGERRLLGDLLQATEKNLKVLQRLRDRKRSVEGSNPWEL